MLVTVTILAAVASQGPSSMWALVESGGRRLVISLTGGGGELPVDSPPLRRARGALPDRFVRHETARFVALSDGDTSWTRQQLERFERAHHQFGRFLDRLGLPEPEIRHKLVAVLFSRHEDFLDFAREVDGVSDPWVKGYYLPAEDRLVGYDAETDSSIREARERLSAQQREIDAAARRDRQRQAQSGRIDPNARGAIDRARSLQGIGEEEVLLSVRRQVVSTMIHEAMHQLFFHSRVQNPNVAPPFWLAEGLAVSFETDRPGQAFGPDFDYAPRREVFERLLLEERLIDLAAFVALEGMPDRREGTARVFYHQGAALLSFLYRERPTELGRYLQSLQQEPPGRPGPARQLELFEAAFGDVARLEGSWLRWELARIASERAAMRRLSLEGPELPLPDRLLPPAPRPLLGGASLPLRFSPEARRRQRSATPA
ncbi:MAG: DUF1570 domain-containing protein [Phycisphaerales bacterium]|jgi:hypothetical protein